MKQSESRRRGDLRLRQFLQGAYVPARVWLSAHARSIHHVRSQRNLQRFTRTTLPRLSYMQECATGSPRESRIVTPIKPLRCPGSATNRLHSHYENHRRRSSQTRRTRYPIWQGFGSYVPGPVCVKPPRCEAQTLTNTTRKADG